MDIEAVEKVAQGRVWQGDKALELGLVDALGDLDVAIEKVAELAELDSWSVRELLDPINPRDELIRQLMQNVGLSQSLQSPDLQLIKKAASYTERAFGPFAYMSDPKQAYVVCLECISINH
jgi:protease-4